MSWHKWWKVELIAGLLIAIDAWPLSICRFVTLMALGFVFSIAYHKRVAGQNASH